MNMTKDPIAPLIPWYVQGSLDPVDRRGVEDHLERCADCRALLETARAAREGVERVGAERMLEHVQAQLLAEFAERPDGLEPGVRRWVAAHVADCAACGGTLDAYRAYLAETDGAVAAPRRTGLRCLWKCERRGKRCRLETRRPHRVTS